MEEEEEEEEEAEEGSEADGAEVLGAVGMAAVAAEVMARTEEDTSAALAKRFTDVSNMWTD